MGYGGHMLLASGALLPLSLAQANLLYNCTSSTSSLLSCAFATTDSSPLWAPLTISAQQPQLSQEATNTADFNIDAASGANGVQTIDLYGTGSTATFGGEPLSGIRLVNQGTSGSDNGSQSNRDGGLAQGIELTTSGSVTLALGSTSPSGMVIGVGVSSLGGDGYDQPSDHNNGGSGGPAYSTTLSNSGNITITGGNSQAGVVAALVESRGGDGGRDNSAVIDYYGGNGGSAEAVELDNYGGVVMAARPAPCKWAPGPGAWVRKV